MLMGVFSYVADITTKEERTLRIGIVNLCISLGVPVGMAFSGILLKLVFTDTKTFSRTIPPNIALVLADKSASTGCSRWPPPCISAR